MLELFILKVTTTTCHTDMKFFTAASRVIADKSVSRHIKRIGQGE